MSEYTKQYYQKNKAHYKKEPTMKTLICEDCDCKFQHKRRNVRRCESCRIKAHKNGTRRCQYDARELLKANRTKACDDCGKEFHCKSRKKMRCPECDKTFRRTRGRVAMKKYEDKMKDDPEYNLARRMRDHLYFALKAQHAPKYYHTKDTWGCTLLELIEHLEKQFKLGMSWSNFGSEWSVDHIKPCAAFDFSKPEQVLQCENYTNLQPLWRQENLAKNSSWQGQRHYHRK